MKVNLKLIANFYADEFLADLIILNIFNIQGGIFNLYSFRHRFTMLIHLNDIGLDHFTSRNLRGLLKIAKPRPQSVNMLGTGIIINLNPIVSDLFLVVDSGLKFRCNTDVKNKFKFRLRVPADLGNYIVMG